MNAFLKTIKSITFTSAFSHYYMLLNNNPLLNTEITLQHVIIKQRFNVNVRQAGRNGTNANVKVSPIEKTEF